MRVDQSSPKGTVRNRAGESSPAEPRADAVVDGGYLVEGDIVDAEIVVCDEVVDSAGDGSHGSEVEPIGPADANIGQMIQRWPGTRGLSWRRAAMGGGRNSTALRWASNPETSFTHFQDAGFWAKDEVLQYWLWALAAEIPENPGTPTWLIAAKQYWEHESQIAGCGYVLPQLNNLVPSAAHVRPLLALVQQAQRRVAGMGRWISRQQLMQNQIAGSGFRWPDGGLSTDLVLGVARDFKALLESEGAGSQGEVSPRRLLAQ